MPDYQSALIHHIKEYSPQLKGYYTDTVYFGGGTPSYYGANRLVAIFEALKKYGKVLVDSEVTAEMNPDSMEKQGLIKMRRAGFNRLSIGVQTTNDKTLNTLGRRHTFAQAEQAIDMAREAGFYNISIDLMYGLPSQTKDDWAESIGMAVSLKPDHISCYGLKIEASTPMYIFKDSPFIPDEDVQADMYLYAVGELGRFGYRQYEISNFARRGMESRHNLKYWRGGEYLGIGAGAHSYIGSRRYSHVADLDKYCKNVLSGQSVVDQSEDITDFERATEYLMLSLRTSYGICEEEYMQIYPGGFTLMAKMMDFFCKHDWAVKNGDRWSLTPQGYLISNTLIGYVLEAQTRERATAKRPWQKDTELNDEQLAFINETGSNAPPVFRGM